MKFISPLLKRSFSYLPDRLTVPIMGGFLKGLRWTPKSANPGQVLGRYESQQERVLVELLAHANVFWDVGAHVGWYSLLAHRQMSVAGRIVAFEPNPDNFSFLCQHIEANGITRIEAKPVALGGSVGELRFSGTHQQGRLSADGDRTVMVTTVDTLLAEGCPPPDLLKVDIEGAELAFLEAADALWETGLPTILLSTHGHKMRDACRELLLGQGYCVEMISSNVADGDYVMLARAAGNSSDQS